MPTDLWEVWIWQRARDLFEHAERVHRNVLSLGQTGSWVPPVNIVETADAVWVVCAVPGADEVELRLEGPSLVIAGRRPPLECCIQGEVRVLEIPFGRFERRVELPLDLSLSLAGSHQEKGLIFVHLKKL